MIVTSLPGRAIFALPIGNTKSSSFGTGEEWPYRISFSRKITGFGSRIAAFKRPFASAAVDGAITFSPGMCEYHDEYSWRAWAANPVEAPVEQRNTTWQPKWTTEM